MLLNPMSRLYYYIIIFWNALEHPHLPQQFSRLALIQQSLSNANFADSISNIIP